MVVKYGDWLHYSILEMWRLCLILYSSWNALLYPVYVNCVLAIDDVNRNDKNGEVRDLVASRVLGSGTLFYCPGSGSDSVASKNPRPGGRVVVVQ